MADVKRKYSSPARAAAAADTRKRLAASARKLFARDGYGATSIAAIAGDAGVAVPTFYATYGSKRAVLFALLNDIEDEAQQAAAIKAVKAAAADPHAQLELIVAFELRLFGTGSDLIDVLRSAGASEPDAAALWGEGEERRRTGQLPVVRGWAKRRALRARLSAEEAAAVLWALTGPDVYRLFVRERGWSPDRFGAWLTETLAIALLRARPQR
jgi:AcrR family transcriptional regulator